MEQPVARYIPDDKDWEIMNMLRVEIIPNSEIAKKLGVSEGMIRQRIKRLKKHGILSLRGLINPEILDNHQLILLGVKIAESKLLAMKAKEIEGLGHVLSVSVVSGRFDLIVELLVDSNHGLIDFLSSELSTVSGVTNTESFVTLTSFSKFV
jgi:Lrp/AsnC family transcriptional regulator, regulator for asnA, asnC and gidA